MTIGMNGDASIHSVQFTTEQYQSIHTVHSICFLSAIIQQKKIIHNGYCHYIQLSLGKYLACFGIIIKTVADVALKAKCHINVTLVRIDVSLMQGREAQYEVRYNLWVPPSFNFV